MPRPKLVPTKEQRGVVRSMAAYGNRQQDIARVVGLRSPKTLRRHFREELESAVMFLSDIELRFVVSHVLAPHSTHDGKTLAEQIEPLIVNRDRFRSICIM